MMMVWNKTVKCIFLLAVMMNYVGTYTKVTTERAVLDVIISLTVRHEDTMVSRVTLQGCLKTEMEVSIT